MSDTIIYHNPKCGTSRNTLALIRNAGIEPQVILYLETPPSRAELQTLLAKLGMRAADLVRQGEAVFKEHYAGRTLSEDEWLDALVAHPILIERPIIVYGARAVIGRPPENALILLDEAN